MPKPKGFLIMAFILLLARSANKSDVVAGNKVITYG